MRVVSSFPEFEKNTSRIFESDPKFLVIQLYGIKESGNFEFRESIVSVIEIAIASSFGFCSGSFSWVSTDCLNFCSRSCWSFWGARAGRRGSTADHGEDEGCRRSFFFSMVVTSKDFLLFDWTFWNRKGGLGTVT